MSKMDDLRAMREARYADAQKRAASASTSTRPSTRPPVAPAADRGGAAPPDPVERGASDDLCGHRNISGRTCTREKGHAAKSHRYS